MIFKITADISSEPVTASEAREWVALDTTLQDTMLGKMLKGARKKIQRLVGQFYGEHTCELTCVMESDGYLELPYSPINSISSVVIFKNGSTETLTSDDYELENGMLYCQAAIGYNVTVTYKAGYSAMPEEIRNLVLKQFAYDYTNRGDAASYCPDVVKESKIYTINNGF